MLLLFLIQTDDELAWLHTRICLDLLPNDLHRYAGTSVVYHLPYKRKWIKLATSLEASSNTTLHLAGSSSAPGMHVSAQQLGFCISGSAHGPDRGPFIG